MQGTRPFTLKDVEIGGANELEEITDKATEMFAEEDEILFAKWEQEERERRLNLLKNDLKSTDDSQILKLTKAKRQIEPKPVFGHVKETRQVDSLLPNQ